MELVFFGFSNEVEDELDDEAISYNYQRLYPDNLLRIPIL